jgi:hypothetical protein
MLDNISCFALGDAMDIEVGYNHLQNRAIITRVGESRQESSGDGAPTERMCHYITVIGDSLRPWRSRGMASSIHWVLIHWRSRLQLGKNIRCTARDRAIPRSSVGTCQANCCHTYRKRNVALGDGDLANTRGLGRTTRGVPWWRALFSVGM